MTKEKEESSVTLIKDPKIEPYFIGRDSHCYTVYQNITPDVKYTEDNKPGKEYIKTLGHYSDFKNCLKAIARRKVNDRKSYDSINEYLETYKQMQRDIDQLLNIGI